MNPHYSSEMADRNLREYLEEMQAAHNEFMETMTILEIAAKDFSEGSHERFRKALRAADIARDNVWYIQQREPKS